MKTIVSLSFIGLVAACSSQTQTFVCDRDAIEWNKWGTIEVPVECRPPLPPIIGWPPESPDDGPSVPRVPNTPTPPTDGPEDEPETPSDPKPRGGPKGNNGWGNGDQSAPGNSGANNNAENDRGGRTQRNHGRANSN